MGLKKIEKINSGDAYWITGLSCAGKTTLAIRLSQYLKSIGKNVIRLDGDELRAILNLENYHTRGDRKRLAIVYSKLTNMLVAQGYDVVIATISLFEEVHIWNRENFKNLKYIFIEVPIEELKRRDPKKIYQNSDKKSPLAGIDFKVDYPKNPNVHILWEKGMNEESIFFEVIKKLKLEIN